MSLREMSFYEDLHFTLGQIIVKYNLIESNIINLICILKNPNNIIEGLEACKGKSASQLISLFKKEVDEKIKDRRVLKIFNKLTEKLIWVIKTRNGYLHSMYFDSENDKIKLEENMTSVSQIKLRELWKMKKQIETSLMTDLSGIHNFIKILDEVDKETNESFGELSTIMPVRQIVYTYHPPKSGDIKP